MPHRKKLPAIHIDSMDVPAAERFERTRAGVGNTFDISLPDASRGRAQADFEFRGTWWRCDKVLVGNAVFDASNQVRAQRNLRADQVDHYRLVLVTGGALRADCDGIRHTLGAGAMVLKDMARPVLEEYDTGGKITLFVPREVLDEAMPRPVDLHGVVPRGAAAELLASHLRGLVDTLPHVTLGEAPSVAQATVALLAASLLASPQGLERARPAVESIVLRQMCRYIEMHLGEQDLAAEKLCAFFGISRSSLYRLFEPLGGVANYIRERRLASAHAWLVGTPAKVVIGELAQHFGFRSLAQFSRAFRTQFGYSPQELRRGECSTVRMASGPPELHNGTTVFEAWVRALRD